MSNNGVTEEAAETPAALPPTAESPQALDLSSLALEIYVSRERFDRVGNEFKAYEETVGPQIQQLLEGAEFYQEYLARKKAAMEAQAEITDFIREAEQLILSHVKMSSPGGSPPE